MDLNKYKSGPGLDKIALSCLLKILEMKKNNGEVPIKILEFGSGFSTQFLVDYKEFSGKNIQIDSFDNDPKWCFQNSDRYDFLNLNVNPLLSCNDANFNNLMKTNSKTQKLYFCPGFYHFDSLSF